MSDAEWDRTQAIFKKGGTPMPSIVKRAAGDRRRTVAGFAGIYIIAASEVAFAVHAFQTARTARDLGPPILVLAIAAAVVIAAHLSMRGAWRDLGTSPRALLDTLERRHAARERMMRYLPWIAGVAITATAALVAAAMIGAGRFSARLLAATVIVCATTAAFARWVLQRERRTIARERREIAEARLLLDDEGRG